MVVVCIHAYNMTDGVVLEGAVAGYIILIYFCGWRVYPAPFSDAWVCTKVPILFAQRLGDLFKSVLWSHSWKWSTSVAKTIIMFGFPKVGTQRSKLVGWFKLTQVDTTQLMTQLKSDKLCYYVLDEKGKRKKIVVIAEPQKGKFSLLTRKLDSN